MCDSIIREQARKHECIFEELPIEIFYLSVSKKIKFKKW